MKIKFNLGKPGQTHVYFLVTQEKREPFIYLINGKMLSHIQQAELETLINEGRYFAVVEYLQKMTDVGLDHGRVFALCRSLLENFIGEKV